MTPSDSIEATAPTVDEAISQALDQLGAHSDDVTIEVLSTPRSGVLGLGARPARVRVTRHTPVVAQSTVQSPPPAPPLKRTPPELSRPAAPRTEGRPVRSAETLVSARSERSITPGLVSGRSEDQDHSDAGANDPSSSERERHSESIAESGERSNRDSASRGRRDSRSDNRRDDRPRRDRGRPARSATQDSSETRPLAGAESELGETESRTDNVPRQRPARRRPASSTGSSQASPESELDSFNDDGSEGDQRELIAPEDQVNEAIKIASEILEMMGEKATIETVRDEVLQTVELNIRGDGSGILIGRHGQTLDALEYIINRILGRRIKDALAIAIDTESYRARRRGQLHRMALSKGEQAKREHITVRLDPMPPRDRRIVHLALKDDPLITTHSFGEGFLRSIEVVPVDSSGERERNDRGSRDRRGRGQDSPSEREDSDLPLGQQGGFKHGQKRIV